MSIPSPSEHLNFSALVRSPHWVEECLCVSCRLEELIFEGFSVVRRIGSHCSLPNIHANWTWEEGGNTAKIGELSFAWREENNGLVDLDQTF